MTVANCASDCCLTCTEWKSAACKLLPTGLPRPSAPWQETQFVLYVLAAESFAGCSNPSDAAAPKTIAITNVLASSSGGNRRLKLIGVGASDEKGVKELLGVLHVEASAVVPNEKDSAIIL